MDLTHDHDRKGMVATVLIHSIIFLLMLIWVMGEAKDMEEPEGGVEVSFGDPNAGGPESISQVSTPQTSQPPPSNPSESKSETDNPMVTNDDVDQPEVENTAKSTPKSQTTEPVKEPVKQEPTISKEMQDALNRFKKNNSNKTTSTGDGPKKGPKGKPTETKKGPGGQSTGLGNGVSYNLTGFGITQNGDIINERKDDGSVTVEFCLDKSGNFLPGSVRVKKSTGSQYLRELTLKSMNLFTFQPMGEQENSNCGTITINYTLH